MEYEITDVELLFLKIKPYIADSKLLFLKNKIQKAPTDNKQKLINMVVYEACSLNQHEVVSYFLESSLFKLESDNFHLFKLAGKKGHDCKIFQRLLAEIPFSSLNEMFWYRVKKRKYDFISKKYEQSWNQKTIDYVINYYENQKFNDFVNKAQTHVN